MTTQSTEGGGWSAYHHPQDGQSRSGPPHHRGPKRAAPPQPVCDLTSGLRLGGGGGGGGVSVKAPDSGGKEQEGGQAGPPVRQDYKEV